MLTLTHPDLLLEIARIPGGLLPLRLPDTGQLVLAIKAQKEGLLAAKVNGTISIYLAPVKATDLETYALVTAFFDDEDEPLTIRSPVFDEASIKEFTELLSAESFQLHLFDEHSRELLVYSAHNDGAAQFKAVANRFRPAPIALARDFLEQMTYWFSHRTEEDDAAALIIRLGEPVFPDDIVILDVTTHATSFQGYKTPLFTMLERDVEPGSFQERDIIKLMQRVFPNDQIYLNPFKPTDGKEFVDVLVVGSENVFLIQAKDSPNTDEILQRSIERKEAAVMDHLQKAVNQLRGSLRYACDNESLRIAIDGDVREISLKGKTLWAIAVVKELFDTEFAAYSAPVLALAREKGVPCVVLDYRELHDYTHHLRSEDDFADALAQVFTVGDERNEFPRLRFGLVRP